MAAPASTQPTKPSPQQEPVRTARALAERFPNSLIVGCTSTGEFCNGDHSNGALVVSALTTPHIRWTAACVPLADFNADVAKATVAKSFADFAIDREELNPDHYVATMIIDGLSMKEELVSAEFAAALDGIRLVGGSAGDDMRFQQTHVFYNGDATSGAAVIVLASAPAGVFKHQHFHRSPVALAAEKTVAILKRRVLALQNGDGKTAIDLQQEEARQRMQRNEQRRALMEARAQQLEAQKAVLEAEVEARTRTIRTILGLVPAGADPQDDALITRLIFSDALSTAEETTEISGRGVGLPALRQAVNACGGTIVVRSTPATGTSFVIDIPRHVAALQAA